jgi:hypothetical protein
MSWAKNNGTWVWTPDGKGNPNKAGDNVTPPPTSPFATGSTDSGTNTTDSIYKVDLGFGLVDKDGNPIALPPIQIGSYITTLAGTDPKAYARVKAAVSALTGKTKLDPNYVGGYVTKLATNIMGSSDVLAKTGTIEDYFRTAAKNAGVAPSKWGNISNPTQAKATINSVVTNLLGREATDKEVKSITKQLTDAQKANPFRQDANGMTIGGVDAQQFVTDIFKAGEEYSSKKQAKQDLVEQGIQETLNANGISYKPGQLKAYSDRVKNGEDIKTIEAEIRNVASLGQPDAIKKLMAAGTDLETIYAPYKRTMAASLGINADTITLDDPTLRMAIGPDKEMSLYDYKKAIRQDNRWKYSQEANDEVTNMINQVKRDFGFMG